MPYPVAYEYYLAIDAIESQERLVDLTVQDYPNSKKEDRAKIHKKLVKMAYSWKKEEQMSFKEFAKATGIDGRRDN